jgi:hypothetical protein
MSTLPHRSHERLASTGRHRARGHEWYLGRLFLALVLLGFGTVALLDSAGAVDGDRAVDRWWPVILILAGVLRLLEGGRAPSVSFLFIAIGAVLLLFTTDAVDGDPGEYVGPAILLSVALLVLAHSRVRPLPAATGDDERPGLRVDGILSHPQVASTSSSFRGAFLTAFLGHVTLDLRQARPIPGGAEVTATATLGGVDIIVPHGWSIEVSGTPILGSIHDKSEREEPLPADAPSLRVDGLAVLGDVNLKHEP